MEEGGRRRFDAELSLDGLGLPEEADLFVEAYHRSAYRRFPFGTVGAPQPPAERWLDGIPVRRPLFRVKVVQREGEIARILAAADKVLPEEQDAETNRRQSLLPVEYEDLGERVWALDLDCDWPRLRLNERIEGIREAARSGAEFSSLVYPEVFRAILERILAEGRFDPDCDDDDWGTLWLRFACRELGAPPPPTGEKEDPTEWIERTVDAFCHRLQALSRFQQLIGGGGTRRGT
ncbi:MAG: hypothetical protein D6795_07060 [Deltaproteobacteria bacterium]|nr:MAG: hypothetical protein D6795_07060 [Deltaproteobacteria bacterium]